MDEEATPTLAAVPGVDLDEYKRTLIERFSNPEVRDTVPRLCAESSDRIPKWLLPVVREQLADDGEITRSAAIVASWARYAEGVDEDGEEIEIVDRRADRLRASSRSDDDPLAFIRNRELFGDLGDDERFAAAYRSALELTARARGARRRSRRWPAAECARSSTTGSGSRPRWRPFRTPRRPRTAWWSASRRPGCAAPTGTAGWATTRTSARSRTCRGTSSPA